jgi:hypothetical protein
MSSFLQNNCPGRKRVQQDKNYIKSNICNMFETRIMNFTFIAISCRVTLIVIAILQDLLLIKKSHCAAISNRTKSYRSLVNYCHNKTSFSLSLTNWL